MNRETRMPLADGRPLIELTTLQTYTLELVGPPEGLGAVSRRDVGRALIGDLVRETEQNLNDLLPEGFYVRIKEWDE